MAGRWRVRLAQAAERDFDDIVRWTAERFGQAQALRYADAMLDAIASLAEGPAVVGSRVPDGLPAGLRTLSVARRGIKAKHLLIYRVRGRSLIEIVRILHDAMDVARHVGGGIRG